MIADQYLPYGFEVGKVIQAYRFGPEGLAPEGRRLKILNIRNGFVQLADAGGEGEAFWANLATALGPGLGWRIVE